MASPELARKINERRSLRLLYEKGPMSRADIARHLGLTRSTIGHVVAGLEDAGLVREYDSAPANGRTGRPGVAIGLNSSGANCIGVEIGVDRIAVVALDLNASVIGRRVRAIDCIGARPDEIVDALADLVDSVCQSNLPAGATIDGLYASVPGLLRRDGTVLYAPILGWRDVPIMAMLSDRFPWPVGVENDANAAAFAESYLNDALRNKDVLLVLIEAGVGAGLVRGGEVVRGAHGLAGEIGHTRLGDIERTKSSAKLTLEKRIGKPALLEQYRRSGGTAAAISDLVGDLTAGSPNARDVVEAWSDRLAAVLADLAYTIDPSHIVIGGEVAAVFPFVEERVRDACNRLLIEGYLVPELVVSRFQADGCAIGCASLSHRRMFEMPELLAS